MEDLLTIVFWIIGILVPVLIFKRAGLMHFAKDMHDAEEREWAEKYKEQD